MSEIFPEFITSLPEPDSPLQSMHAWMIQSPEAIAMFYEFPERLDLPEHAHGAQWGVVVAGRIEFTIGGETRLYERGETYSIPAGVPHSAVIHAGFAGIDVFADADRYRPKPRATER